VVFLWGKILKRKLKQRENREKPKTKNQNWDSGAEEGYFPTSLRSGGSAHLFEMAAAVLRVLVLSNGGRCRQTILPAMEGCCLDTLPCFGYSFVGGIHNPVTPNAPVKSTCVGFTFLSMNGIGGLTTHLQI
jgi:hypothetical protein